MKATLFETWDSALVNATEYTREDQELVIEFNNGARYLYKNFTADDYLAFLEAESKGKHFLTHIRSRYKDSDDIIKLETA
jgi:hypothetical protein